MVIRVQTGSVTGRLAPSPTGHLHLGHALAFCLAWWHARKQGGRVVLRLEDLDVERATLAHADEAKRDLEWLGLDWDGPARLQSEGLERIVSAARSLERAGLAFACTCTRGDLRAFGAPQAGSDELRYAGRCRGRYPSLESAALASGRGAGLRLLVDAGDVLTDDENFGPSARDVSAEVGDFMILRRSGSPAYQLAVVIDDAYDEVTEVVRGADLLPSTARQRLLQMALGLPVPRYFHVPLLVDEHGQRFAKRADSLSLRELRESGVDPRAIVAFVARATGQAPPGALQLASATEYVGQFQAGQVGTEPIAFGSQSLAELRAPGR